MSEKETESEIKSIPLSELEELFKHRYTDNDGEYMKLKQKPLPPPPIVCPFDQIRQRRNRDRNFDRRTDQRYDGDHRYKGQRHNSPRWSYNDRRDKSTSSDRTYDRRSDWERGYTDRNVKDNFNR